jgi:hypothetical protein
MGLAWRHPSRDRHCQRSRPLKRKHGDTRPGLIPNPPRPRPARARPALPQELAAPFCKGGVALRAGQQCLPMAQVASDSIHSPRVIANVRRISCSIVVFGDVDSAFAGETARAILALRFTSRSAIQCPCTVAGPIQRSCCSCMCSPGATSAAFRCPNRP